MTPYNESEWVHNYLAIRMQRGVDAIDAKFRRDWSDAAEDAHFTLGAAVLIAIREARSRVAEYCAPWFDNSAFQ